MHGNKRCILVVDDEPRMVYSLRAFLSANSFSVIEAQSGEEALDKYWENSRQIDLILLDAVMPEKSGLEVLKELRESACMVPVIALTSDEEDSDEIKELNTVADECVQKPFSPTALLNKIEALLKRLGKTGDREIVAGRIRVDLVRHSVYVDDKEVELARREYNLLVYFINNPGITLTREELLNHVWGYDFNGSIRTVDTHVKQLRLKLKGCEDYIRTIHCVGYRFQAI